MLFVLAFHLSFVSTLLYAQALDEDFCKDTILNGKLYFTDNYAVDKVGHITTNDSGSLIFAAIKNGDWRSRVIKLKKDNTVEWSTDFYEVRPGYKFSIQQAVENAGNFVFAGILQKADNSVPPSVFLISKIGNTNFGFQKEFRFLPPFFLGGINTLSINGISINGSGQIIMGFSLGFQSYYYSGVAAFSSDCSLQWSKLLGHPSEENLYGTVGVDFNNDDVILCSSGYTTSPNANLPAAENLLYTSFGPNGNIKASSIVSINRNVVSGSGAGISSTGYFKKKNNLFYTQMILAGDYSIRGAEPIFYTSVLDENFNILRSEQLRNSFDYIGVNARFAVDEKGNQMRLTAQPDSDSLIYVAAFSNGSSLWQRSYTIPFKQKEGSFSLSDIPGRAAVYKTVYAKKEESRIYINRLQFNALNELDCATKKDTAIVNALSMPVASKAHAWQQVYESVIEEVSHQMTISQPAITYQPSCTQMIDCSSLKLEGPKNVCKSDSLYTFLAHRSTQCNNPIKWMVDSAKVSFIYAKDDTTLLIKFLPGREIKIKAVMEGCYMLQDSVLINTTSMPLPFFAGGKKVLCSGQTMRVRLPDGYQQYKWDGDTGKEIVVDKPGAYIATALDECNNFYSDTLIVYADTLLYTPLFSQFEKCAEDSLSLNVPAGYMNYQWMPQNALDLVSNNEVKVWPEAKSQYTVSMQSPAGCSYTDSFLVNIKALPAVTLPNDTSICAGEKLSLEPSEAFTQYMWSTGDTTKQITITKPGIYTLKAKAANACKGEGRFQLLALYPKPKNFLPRDTTKCQGEVLILNSAQSFSYYNWSTGSAMPFAEIHAPGIYSLKVASKEGCEGVEDIIVKEKGCKPVIHFPTAFTPNGDGLNDSFRPICMQKPESYELRIYNRWGELVFVSKEWQKGWDGRNREKIQPGGVYVWMCNWQFNGFLPQRSKGSFVLIR